MDSTITSIQASYSRTETKLEKKEKKNELKGFENPLPRHFEYRIAPNLDKGKSFSIFQMDSEDPYAMDCCRQVSQKINDFNNPPILSATIGC